MIFNTWVFAVFLIVTVTAYWLSSSRLRPWILSLFGFFFYWWYYPPHLPLILGLTGFVYWGAKLIDARRQRGGGDRALFVVFGGGALAVLAYYKYMGFIWNSLATWAAWAGLQIDIPDLDIRAPLAISFFTFEFVHYLIEVHRGTIRPDSFRKFLLFIMFFPTLVCGPIKRYGDFEGQVDTARFNAGDAFEGIRRIVIGLGKKFLVADALGPFCLAVLGDPDSYSVAELWLGAYAYSLHILFDFSGYSDIAIGSAMLLGFHVPENFNYPYLQRNIRDFWRSWHMSLTSWITDYVYISMGGSRRGRLRTYWNRFAAMTLCGLWHGAGFHFVVWGALHGVALNVHAYSNELRTAKGWRSPAPALVGRVLSTLLTYHFVCLCWIYFVVDVPEATSMVLRMLGL